MKKKTFSILFSLVLVLSLGLVMATPVAATVGAATVTPDPSGVGQAAEYTIVFDTTEDLAVSADDDIRIEFPDDTTVLGSYVNNSISINGVDVDTGIVGVDVAIVGRLLTIDVPEDVAHGTVTVVFKAAAGLANPMVLGPYTLEVSTSREVTPVPSNVYQITGPEGPVDLYDTSGEVNVFIASYDEISAAIEDLETTNEGYVQPADWEDWLIVAHADMGPFGPFTLADFTDVTVMSTSQAVVEGAQVVTTTYKGVVDCVVFVIDSTNIVLQDLDIQGDGLGEGESVTWNSGVIYETSTGEITDCVVSPNTIGDMTSYGIGMWSGSNVTIDPCTVENFGRVGIYIRGTALIEDTTIIGQVYTEEGEFCYGVEVEEVIGEGESPSYVTILDSEIYNCDSAGRDYDVQTGKIVGETCESAGVYINGWLEFQAVSDSQVIIKRTKIHDNFVGIWVVNSSASHACFNDIYDNRMYGVYSVPDFDGGKTRFDATRNYWGDPSGPSTGDDRAGVPPRLRGWPLGTGDAITGEHTVEYRPWLTYPYADVVDESAQWYGGAYSVELGPGWNTLSTPVPLDDRADQLGEIVALGGWMQNYVIGYSYDPVGGWQLLTGDFQMLPCSAIYVLMSDDDLFPCLKKGEFYIPTKDVPEGWNLVSLNYYEPMLAYPALTSIATMPGMGGYSQVISPPLPNQQPSWVWAPTVPAIMPVPTPYLSPGWGYWVYMTGDGTLAGYLMTPQVLTEAELEFLSCQVPEWGEDLYQFPNDYGWDLWPGGGP